jgi:hypothetical protein
VLADARGQAGKSEYVEDADILVISNPAVLACDFSTMFEDEQASGKSSGRRSADLLGDASEDFGGLNLIVMALPVRKAELNREGSFFGLLATSFSSR